MIKLWSMEAFAHGAEVVSYFRWRQAPFGQEQMHAGLLRPDNHPAPGLLEVAEVAQDIASRPDVEAGQAEVAVIFDDESAWPIQVQPQGQAQDYFALVFEMYRALRRLGLNVDVIAKDASPQGYKLIAAPGLLQVPVALQTSNALKIFGPRTGAKTADFSIRPNLPPDLCGLNCRITQVESLRADMRIPLEGGGYVQHWFETLETNEKTLIQTADGLHTVIRADHSVYIAGQHDPGSLDTLYDGWAKELGLTCSKMPTGVRQRCTEQHGLIFNQLPAIKPSRACNCRPHR